MDSLTFVWQKHKSEKNSQNERGTTSWGFLNHLISHLPFNIILLGYQHPTFCRCGIPQFTFCYHESTLSLYATYCHCNIHLTFSNTTFHPKINKLQLSIKTVTRTGIHTHQHISHISYIYTYTLWKNNINKLC